MRYRHLPVVLFLLSCYNTSAQIKDSVLYYIKHSKPELIGGFTSRNTFIGSNRTSVTGINGGMDYGGKVRWTAGIYWLSSPLEVRKTINEFTPLRKEVLEVSRFWYWGLSGTYVFYRKNKWTLDFPLRIGIGSALVKQFELPPSKTLLSKNNSMIFPVESGVSALYKLTWWIGFSGGLGSRFVLGKNNAQKFGGTYYNLGTTIFLGDIYQHIRRDMKQNPSKGSKAFSF